MDDIYLVETGDLSGEAEIENLWDSLADAENYALVKIDQSEADYQRDTSKENDDSLRYWSDGYHFICIKIKTVE